MKWFKVQALANNPRAAHIAITQPIGSDWAPDWIKDFTNEKAANDFINEVEALGDIDEIQLEINCPGGDVASGIRIFNYLRGHKATIHVRVTGMAASIATVIMMVGDTRTMAVGTTIMVHRAASLMVGFYTAAEMRDFADNIDVIDAAVVDAYALSTGKSADEIAALLDQGDTYMGAGEAIEWGFATDRDDQLQAVACADPTVFMQQLQQQGRVRQRQTPPASTPPAPEPQNVITPLAAIAKALDVDAGELEKSAQPALDAITSLRAAPTAESLRKSHKDVVATIEKDGAKAEQTRIKTIMQTCRTANQVQLIDKLIDNGSDGQAVSDYVYDVANAASGASHINSHHSPEGGGNKAAGIDPTKIYNRLNRKPGAR